MTENIQQIIQIAKGLDLLQRPYFSGAQMLEVLEELKKASIMSEDLRAKANQYEAKAMQCKYEFKIIADERDALKALLKEIWNVVL